MSLMGDGAPPPRTHCPFMFVPLHGTRAGVLEENPCGGRSGTEHSETTGASLLRASVMVFGKVPGVKT